MTYCKTSLYRKITKLNILNKTQRHTVNDQTKKYQELSFKKKWDSDQKKAVLLENG